MRKLDVGRCKNKILLVLLVVVVAVVAGSLCFVGCDFFDEQKYSEGLEYSFNNNKTAVVEGIGSCQDTDLLIPPAIEGYKVTGIGENAFYRCSFTSVTIPDSVTDIGGNAFRECTIENATIPASVCRYVNNSDLKKVVITSGKTIEENAFAKCGMLTSVTIPKSITSIGYGAFYECSSLTEITIPNGVTQIGPSTFYGCTSLTSVTIPESVTEIDYCAFEDCISLTSIIIPSNVKRISSNAFKGCYRLIEVYNKSSLEITAGSEEYGVAYYAKNVYTKRGESKLSVDNDFVIYTDGEDKMLVMCTGTNKSQLTIPSGITQINDYAFWGCTSLTTITIPDSVTRLEDNAFKFGNYRTCPINTATIPAIACKYINSSNLTTVVITSGEEIEEYAFANCENLTEITIPSSIISVGKGAFLDCENLTAVHISDIAAWCNINFARINYSFHYSTSNPLAWARNLYLNNESVVNLVIPDTVTQIKDDVFYNCSDLKSVTMSNSVTKVGVGAFKNCTNLANVTMSDNITNVGGEAFKNCCSLTSITIPSSVTTIDDDAFDGCYRLIEVCNKSSFAITAGDEWKGKVAYYAKNVYANENESKLTTDNDGFVIYTDGEDKVLVGYNGDKTEIVLPDGITEIYSYAFYNCSNLRQVVIPASVVTIGANAFEKCSKLIAVTIPDSVTTIGWSAFYECAKLTKLTIGKAVSSIGDYAFARCYLLVEVCNKSSLAITAGIKDNGYAGYSALNIYANDGESKLSVDSDGFVVYSDGKDKILVGYGGYESEITIPDGITEIYNNAFEGYSLTNVTIPDSVTKIGDDAFNDCPIEIATIPAMACPYVNNDNLKKIVVTSGEEIPYRAFYKCKSLTEVTIASCITSIDSAAFYKCVNLASINIPNSVTSIYSEAFVDCYSLTSIIIPDGVTFIGYRAFESCQGLKEIVLPRSLTNIVDEAFYACYGLKSVYYKGTWDEWCHIDISIKLNDAVRLDATKYYYSESNPFEGENAATEGNYWHYAEDGETILVWNEQ